MKAFAEFLKLDTIALGTAAVRGLLQRYPVPRADIDAIVWGGVILPGLAPNVGREIALDLKLPPKVEAMTVTRACTSGLQAITLAAAAIERGEADVDHRRRLGLDQQRRGEAAAEAGARRRAADVRQGHRRRRAGHAAQAGAGVRGAAARAPHRRAHHRQADGRVGRGDGRAQRDLPGGPGRAGGALAPPRRRGHRRRPLRQRGHPGRDRGQDRAHRHHRARRHQRGEAGQAEAGVRQARHADRRQLHPADRRRRRRAADERGEGRRRWA